MSISNPDLLGGATNVDDAGGESRCHKVVGEKMSSALSLGSMEGDGGHPQASPPQPDWSPSTGETLAREEDMELLAVVSGQGSKHVGAWIEKEQNTPDVH